MSNEEVEYRGRPDEILAFSRFKEEIENEASIKAKAVEEEAEKQVTEMIATAKKEVEKIKNDILSAASREVDQIKVREVSRKKLSVKMDYIKSRDQIFEEILLETRSKLQKFTKSAKYGKFILKLLQESSLAMDGGSLTVHLRSDDKSLLTKENLQQIASEISKATGNQTEFVVSKSDLDCLGGLKLVRDDNRLFIDNTFEARLNRLDDDIRSVLSSILEN